MASSVHGRSKEDASGDTSKVSVQTANKIATRTALILLLAEVLEILWIVPWLSLTPPISPDTLNPNL